MNSCINKKAIWITWEQQVRNRSLAKLLNIPLFEIDIVGSRIRRYFTSIKLTLRILKQHKPGIVFQQNPSIILTITTLFFSYFFKYKVVVDCHNAGIYPFEGRSIFFNSLAKFLAKNADLIIVHNQSVANTVNYWGTNFVVLADPLPEQKKIVCNTDETADKPCVLFICSWSDDEPYKQVIEVGHMFEKRQSQHKIYITGKVPNNIEVSNLPINIILTGYLPYGEYVSLLVNSTMVMALTERNNSLNCGGYEAMSYEKPCILSDTPVLRDVFNKPFVFTKNNAQGIFTSIEQTLATKNNIHIEMKKRKQTYLADFSLTFDRFVERVNRL